MIAEELINQMIPPLKPTDQVMKARQWMEELRIDQLPVIEKESYMGLVSEEIILDLDRDDALVSDLRLSGKDIFVRYNQHFYDILRQASAHNVQMVAVVGEENNFLGVVTVNDTVYAIADSTAMQEAGGILVLLLDQRDYSLTEISRLVESNNAKILSVNIASDKENPEKLRVTIKINKTNLNRIVATFERFNYRIIAKFQSGDNQDSDRDRINILLKYLDI